MGRLAKGAGNVADKSTNRDGDYLLRRGSDGLDKEGYGTQLRIGIADGKRDPFLTPVCPDDHELTCAACLGHPWCTHHQTVEVGGQDVVTDYFKHVINHLFEML
jgi:hypothetical protein